MPIINGFQILEQLRSARSQHINLPVIGFTVDATRETRTRALELGAADLLIKPGDPSEIILRVRHFIELRYTQKNLQDVNAKFENLVIERTTQLLDAHKETLRCLTKAGEYRDDQPGEHNKRVGELSAKIGSEIGLHSVEVTVLRAAATLHDIGNIGIRDSIFLKIERLTPHEFKQVQQHTLIGADILGDCRSPELIMAREIALYHHEWWDGTGYCEGLKGINIPITARIVSVADAFDVMVSDRPYRIARTLAEAIDRIKLASGSQFDPSVVNAFLSVMSADRLKRSA